MKTVLLALIASTLSACSSGPKEPTKARPVAPATLEEAIAAPIRTPEMSARDQYRHPLETLKFFGIESHMTVVEISPSNGWYTQILAPFLNEKGQYIAAKVPSSVAPYMKQMNEARAAWLASHPELTSKTKTVEFNPGTQELAPENSVDAVLTFRNVHNWMAMGGEKQAFQSFFKALKPGGTLGVVEHRAKATQKKDPKAKSGYVREKDVIQMAKAAGFQFVASSEINSNPKDLKNYKDGVWTLPPALRLKEKDREKYLAIGESDRMTLKFVKPSK